MPDGAVITLATFKLERDNFLVFALLDNFRRHLCAGNKRIAMRQSVALGVHQNMAERCGLARFDLEKIDIDRFAFRDTILSSTGFDNCVSHKRVRGEKAAQSSTDAWVWQTESVVAAAALSGNFVLLPEMAAATTLKSLTRSRLWARVPPNGQEGREQRRGGILRIFS